MAGNLADQLLASGQVHRLRKDRAIHRSQDCASVNRDIVFMLNTLTKIQAFWLYSAVTFKSTAQVMPVRALPTENHP